MTFWLSVLALARLRVVAVPMAVAGVVLAVLGFLVPPTVWTSDATAVLTGSPVNQSAQAGDRSQSPEINPLLNFNDSLTTTVSIVVQAMNTPAVAADLGAVDGPTSVVVTDVGPTELLGSKGPFLFVSARSTESGQAAAAMAQRTLDRAAQELLQRQQAVNAPPAQLISVLPVVSPAVPAANLQYRVAGAVVGFVLGALAVLAYIYWRRVRRLRARSEKPRAVVPGTSEQSSSEAKEAEAAVVAAGSALASTNGHGMPTPSAGAASGVSSASGDSAPADEAAPHRPHWWFRLAPFRRTSSPEVALSDGSDTPPEEEPTTDDHNGSSAALRPCENGETDDPAKDHVARSAPGRNGHSGD